MSRFKDSDGGVIDVPAELDGVYLSRPGYTLVEQPLSEDEAEETAAELKGEALDQALRDADLSTTGKADDKRARLAEHLANPPQPNTESHLAGEPVTDENEEDPDA